MENTTKIIKVSEKHHKMLKEYCDKKGLKIYKIVQKWIDDACKQEKSTEIQNKKDIYGD